MAYHTFMNRVRLSSCWAEMDADGLLPASAAPSDLEMPESQDDVFIYRQGVILTQVRRALQAQNKPLLAYRLCKTEANMYEGDLSLMPYREWLRYIEGTEDVKSEVIVTKKAFHHIFAAWNLADQQLADKAGDEIGALVTLLSSIGRSLDDLETFYPRGAVYMEWVRILMDLAVPGTVVTIERVTDLQKRAAELGDFPMVRVIYHKLIKLSETYAETTLIDREDAEEQEDVGDPWEWHDDVTSCYLEFEEQQMRAAYFMAAALSPAFSKLAYRGGTRSVEVLKYYSEFRAKFPRFDVPTMLHLLLHSAISATKWSGDDRLTAEFTDERDRLSSQCPKDAPQNVRKAEQKSLGHSWNAACFSMSRKVAWDYMIPVSSRILLRWLHQAVLIGECSPETASACLGLRGTTNEHGELGHLAEITELYHEPTEEDCQRLSTRIFGKDGIPVSSDEWGAWYAVVTAWLRDTPVLGRTVEERHQLLSKLQQCRVELLFCAQQQRLVAPDRDFLYEVAVERHRSMSTMLELDISLFVSRIFRTERIQYCSDLVLLCTRGDATEDLRVTDDMLSAAVGYISDDIADPEIASNLDRLLRAMQTREFLLYNRRFHFKSVPRLAAYLDWQEGDVIYQLARDQHSSLQGSRALMVRSSFAQDHDIPYHFTRGVQHSYNVWMDHIRSARFRQPIGACQWLHYFQNPTLLRAGFYDHVQKCKARVLTDLMGINAQLPAALVQAVEDDPEARAMLEEETALRGRIASVESISEKLALNGELGRLRRRMRTNPALVPINQIREGQAVSLAEVKQMGERLGGNVVFVDWVHVGLESGADLLMVICADGRLRQTTQLPLKLKDVDRWVAEQLDEDLPLLRDTSQRQLRTMHPLVAPLATYTEPGQVLVLCPTRALHRIPLHALKVDGRLLIERNPVVYCQSLSVLRLCQMAATTTSPHSAPRGRPLALHPLHVGGAAHSQAHSIAALLGGDVVADADMTKEGVKAALGSRGAPVVHFHGHVQFEESGPLHHRLELRVRPPAPSTIDGDAGGADDDGGGAGDLSAADTLEADDIFDVRLPRPTHVTLMGCRSGRSVITGADDHLGLTTALHYAGASSVLSTLWKIDTEDGLEFSKLFYGEFWREEDGLGKGDDGEGKGARVVNLAIAMQKAVLGLRRRNKIPYHWAGFVLHGMWLFKL